MKKIIEIKNKKIFFMLFIMVVATIYFTSKAFANEEDTDLSYSTIHCEYEGKQTGFTYSNEMFLKNSEELSTDMAKMSVILSACAYHSDSISDVLSAMGFMERSLYNYYDRTATLEDNDYVAFAIASKNIKYKGQDYKIYVVPIRGTPESAEWFSNFRISEDNDSSKTTGNHYGFYTAANEVRNEISYRANNDGIPAERTVVLLTGHSRGAAVANIVAGQLSGSKYSNYLSKEHIFGYTYACPAVSKFADDTLTNIYNFNNPGDMVPLLPLKEWQYKRFGKTIELDTSHWSNIEKRFNDVCGKKFETMDNTNLYHQIIVDISKNEVDFFKFKTQFILNYIAYTMGGDNSASWIDMLCYYFWTKGPNTISGIFDKILDDFERIKVEKEFDEYKIFITAVVQQTSNLTEEEFEQWLIDNPNAIEKIKNRTQVILRNKEDLKTAIQISDDQEMLLKQLVDIVKDCNDAGFSLGEIPNLEEQILQRTPKRDICYLD